MESETHPPSGEMVLFQAEDGRTQVQVRMEGDSVWLSQRGIAELYQVSVKTANERLVDHYNLDAILAVGYRVRSPRGTQFRRWATEQLKELLVKGFVLDDQRLEAGRSLGQDYFDELLSRIRSIRASERRFYQKITDIYATSMDYDSNATLTQGFYATVQNKLHFAIHGQTAAEVIQARADAGKPNMGLTNWKNSPEGGVRRTDTRVAKNYLTEEELSALHRIVSMYLDYAESQAERRAPMHMKDWVKKLDDFLRFNERNILTHAGKVSSEIAETTALREFEKYEAERRKVETTQPTSDFDQVVEATRRLKRSAPPASQPRASVKTHQPKKPG